MRAGKTLEKDAAAARQRSYVGLAPFRAEMRDVEARTAWQYKEDTAAGALFAKSALGGWPGVRFGAARDVRRFARTRIRARTARCTPPASSRLSRRAAA